MRLLLSLLVVVGCAPPQQAPPPSPSAATMPDFRKTWFEGQPPAFKVRAEMLDVVGPYICGDRLCMESRSHVKSGEKTPLGNYMTFKVWKPRALDDEKPWYVRIYMRGSDGSSEIIHKETLRNSNAGGHSIWVDAGWYDAGSTMNDAWKMGGPTGRQDYVVIVTDKNYGLALASGQRSKLRWGMAHLHHVKERR